MNKEIEISLNQIKKYARALHCPTRWKIIHFLGEGEKSTGQIREHLEDICHSTGEQNLYYHLSELSSAGIIEVAQYREEGGGAPEKVWSLAVEKITITLLGGELSDGCEN
ncbi:winged helix-turn-helix transcriptional regulator [Candidatus Bipolaricaulota bacterium]|nr:winged helix-turn-helix transcriptional regulator [Candidatus Bipolaricaulota bacterium]MBS3814691.1 winged helix-turn-helix transcriptional regulator [Candidatus Bipolaricaulota bacterium]MBS3825838.1 winged helix-turn-helix transcriptional regulator [Candidatus Bipolaricaulota bacterium]